MIQRVMSRSEIETRSDDKNEVLVTRFQVYEESTKPIVEYFKSQGKCIHIDGNQDVDVVYEGLKKKILE